MNLLNEELLLDSFVRSGTDLEELKELLTDMEEHTRVENIALSDLTLLSYSEKHTNENRLGFFKLSPKKIWDDKQGLYNAVITRDNILKNGSFEPLLSEFENITRLMMMNGGSVYFTSDGIMTTLSARADIGGNFLLSPSLERDIAIASQFGKTYNTTSAIVREFNNCRKIFALHSSKYLYISQLVLCEILGQIKTTGSLGEMVCHRWIVTNDKAEVYIEFPQVAEDMRMLYGIDVDLVPGVYLASSDTGRCSITARGTWRLNDSTCYTENEYKRAHKGNEVSVEEIVKHAEVKVFGEYAKLPDRLCELMALDITEEGWHTLTKKSFQVKNRDKILSILKNVFKQINLTDAIGKKNADKLYEEVGCEFDWSQNYTAYDIAISLLTIPARCEGLSPIVMERLQKSIGRVPYVSYREDVSSLKLI